MKVQLAVFLGLVVAAQLISAETSFHMPRNHQKLAEEDDGVLGHESPQTHTRHKKYLSNSAITLGGFIGTVVAPIRVNPGARLQPATGAGSRAGIAVTPISYRPAHRPQNSPSFVPSAFAPSRPDFFGRPATSIFSTTTTMPEMFRPATAADRITLDPGTPSSLPSMPELRVNQLSLVELGEFGALASDASYFGTTGTPVTDPEELKLGMQMFLESHMEKSNYQPEVKAVYRNEAMMTMMYSMTAEVTQHGKPGRHKACVLCFRGTTGSLLDPNWRNNLKSFVIEDDKPAGMKHSYDSLREHVIEAIKEAGGIQGELDLSNLETIFPGGVIIVGHSLGGSMATYAMLDLLDTLNEERGYTDSDAPSSFPRGYFRVLTYGQPRDFSLSSATKVQERLWGVKTRFVSEGDIVPSSPVPLAMSAKNLPPESRFSHTGRAVFLDQVSEPVGETADFVARDAGLDLDFSGNGSGTMFGLAIHTRVNPVEFHLSPHYVIALEAARQALGDRRKLFKIGSAVV